MKHLDDNVSSFPRTQCVVNKAAVFATSSAQVALLTNCLRALSHCISDDHQRDALEAVKILMYQCLPMSQCMSRLVDLLQDRKRLLTTFQQQKLVSDGRRKYDAVFNQEVKLNEEYRIFVQNYQRAYEGRFSGKQGKNRLKVTNTVPVPQVLNAQKKHGQVIYFILNAINRRLWSRSRFASRTKFSPASGSLFRHN